MKTIKREVVAAIIRSKDNKMLMLQKNPSLGGVYLGCWHIPGGGREINETYEQALIRELKEELGIDTTLISKKLIDNEGTDISKRIHKDSKKDVMVDMRFIIYELNIDKHSDEITIRLSEEHIEFKWFDLKEVKTARVTPPSTRLFKKIGYM